MEKKKIIIIYFITAIVAFLIGAVVMTMIYKLNQSEINCQKQYRQCEIEKENLNNALIRCSFGVE